MTSSTNPGLALPVLGGAATVPTTVVAAHCLPSGHVGHAIQVAEAIKASGLGCDTADLISESARKLGVPDTPGLPKSDVVDCAIGDEDVTITLYADHTALMSAGPYLREAECYMRSHQSPNTVYPPNTTYVAGDNWIVFPMKKATAEAVATSIGGALRTNEC